MLIAKLYKTEALNEPTKYLIKGSAKRANAASWENYPTRAKNIFGGNNPSAAANDVLSSGRRALSFPVQGRARRDKGHCSFQLHRNEGGVRRLSKASGT